VTRNLLNLSLTLDPPARLSNWVGALSLTLDCCQTAKCHRAGVLTFHSLLLLLLHPGLGSGARDSHLAPAGRRGPTRRPVLSLLPLFPSEDVPSSKQYGILQWKTGPRSGHAARRADKKPSWSNLDKSAQRRILPQSPCCDESRTSLARAPETCSNHLGALLQRCSHSGSWRTAGCHQRPAPDLYSSCHLVRSLPEDTWKHAQIGICPNIGGVIPASWPPVDHHLDPNCREGGPFRVSCLSPYNHF